MAIAGMTVDKNPSRGISRGQMMPTVPIASFMAMETLRSGGLWTAPSNLSAHAA